MAVRRVRRILRGIDPWTVLKVSLVFNAIAALTFVLGTWVTWSLVLRRGIPDRVIDIFESLTLTITVEGELYFRIVVLLAIIGAILATAAMTLGAVLYNLIADLVGGVEFAVLEESYRPASTRTRMAPIIEPAPAAQMQVEVPPPDVEWGQVESEPDDPGGSLPLAVPAAEVAETLSAPVVSSEADQSASRDEMPASGDAAEPDVDEDDTTRVRAG